MSAAEEDTELRDLLIQTLENNGVLNKIKAELRASVFLALEEQERCENKTSLVNESLKKFLNTRDGRLIVSLFTEFLKFFNLDFTLAVFQPEGCLGSVTDDRSHLSRDLGIVESESTKNGPLLLDLVKKWRLKDKLISGGEELSPKQIAEAQKKFDLYDKDNNGEISKDELRSLFVDLFPHFHRNMLERYVNDEFKAADKDFNNGINFREFIGMYKRLFIHCRSVVAHDVSDIIHSPRRVIEGKMSAQNTHSKVVDISSENSNSLSRELKKNTSINDVKQESKPDLFSLQSSETKALGFDQDDLEGDSFFDDPIPKPEKVYVCQSVRDANNSWEPISDTGGSTPQKQRNEVSKPEGDRSSLTAAQPLKTDLSSLSEAAHPKDSDQELQHDSLTNLKLISGKISSIEPEVNTNVGVNVSNTSSGDEDDEYVDDFNSHRSDRSEVSIGEEIEEDISTDDFNISDKLEDVTFDHTLSHVSDVADYLENVS